MTPIGPALRTAASRIAQREARLLSAHGVTLAESELLRAVFDSGPTAPSAVADRLGLTRGAVSKLVDRLRAKRLLVRAASGTADRRYQTLALTGGGAMLMPALVQAAENCEATAFGHLSANDRAKIVALLARIPSG